jgi:hypothetical protein
VLIIFFMPGGVVFGLRWLRSKIVMIVPRLPGPKQQEEAIIEAEPAGSMLSTEPVNQPQGGSSP